MTMRAVLCLGLGSVALVACSDDAAKKVRVDPITVLRIGEGSNAQFGVALTSPPDAPVTIALHPEAIDRVTLDPNPLVFMPGQSDKQMVTVHAVDNPDVEGDQSFYVRAAAVSDDLDYQGAAVEDVFVTITDDDAPGIVVDPKAPMVGEGSMAALSIRLASRPRAPVSFTIGTRDPRFMQGPATYTFQPLTWDRPQTMSVAAVDDNFVLDAGPAMLDVSAFASADPAQGGFQPPPIAVAIAENDMPGVEFKDPFGNINFSSARENNHANVEVRLLSQPTAPVTIELVPHDPRMSPASVTIPTGDWNIQHEILLAVIDDSVHEGDVSVMVDVISHSADPVYSEKTLPMARVFVSDDD
jgi:hypothetical protein